MYFFANSSDWERHFNFVQSMCHSLDFEECSKPKFKSVGLHFTVPQIDKVWDGSVHSHNMVEGARGRVCNLKCRFVFDQSGNWKMYTHPINLDAFSYDAVKISWWVDARLRFPAKMSRWPWRSTRYELPLFRTGPKSEQPTFKCNICFNFTHRTSRIRSQSTESTHSEEPCEWFRHNLQVLLVKFGQILHLKVDCTDFGPVRDRGRLPHRLIQTHPRNIYVWELRCSYRYSLVMKLELLYPGKCFKK